MAEAGVRQRLAAILAADAAGYSCLMAADEHGTLQALDAARAIFHRHVERHHGRIIDTAGDSVLAVFDLATGAVGAAVAIQQDLHEREEGVPEARRMHFRIGVHLGEIIEKPDGTIYGDGVNIAAHLQGLAEPGGIAVSDAVHGSVKNRVAVGFDDLGKQRLKNISEPLHVFKVAGNVPSGMPAVQARAVPERLAVIQPNFADSEVGRIRLDSETTLAAIPPEAREYKPGNRGALEWILHQHKANVIDLLAPSASG